jgi:hypothetical protein
VGDYAVRLGEPLEHLGHSCAFLALNDQHIHADGEASDKKVRLSAVSPQQERIKKASALVSRFQPDVVSLQYVPYGFNRRGLPWQLASHLGRIAPMARWHIMFHELWVGITRSSPWKHRVIGAFQQRIASSLVARLRPQVIHTSNPLYVALLEAAGIRAERLPLFGNVDADSSERDWMIEELSQLGIMSEERHRWFIVGMFGSCYPDYPLARQVRRAAGEAEALGRRLAVLGIGGGVGTGSPWETEVRASAPIRAVKHYGRQSSARVSALLSSLDLGLCSTPREFIGKSGAAAVMFLHGVKLDESYTADLPEYRHLKLAEVPMDDLFCPAREAATRMVTSMEQAEI